MLPTSVDVHAPEIKLCINNFEGSQNTQDKHGMLY